MDEAGYAAATGGQAMKWRMPETQEEARHVQAPVFESDDKRFFDAEIKLTGAKSVLEFGPGDSTQVLLDLGVERIVTCENIDKWFDVAKERFKDEKRVTVLKFHDEMPVVVDGLDDQEKFDLGFVDAPKGFNPVRKIHPGYGDCSRLNTLLYAVDRCKVVILHDAMRPLERGSLGRLWTTGLVDIEFLPTRLGIARITRREQKPNGIDPQNATEPGSAATGAEPECRGEPVD